MNNPIKLFFKEENSEKTPNYNSSEINQSNPIETVKVDLRELGYKKAGATGGNLESLKNLMQDISNGYFIDVNEDEETQQKEKQKIKGEIDILNVEKSHQEGELKKILLTDIPNSNAQISDLNQERINLEIEYEKSKNNTTRSNFNLNLYWPVFVAATIFLYGFYLSAFHTAFFKEINKAASEADSNNISELLNTVFNVENANINGKIEIVGSTLKENAVFFEGKVRTAKLNSLLSLIAYADGQHRGDKKQKGSKNCSLSGIVPCGFDLSNIVDDFQALRILMNSRNWKSLF